MDDDWARADLASRELPELRGLLSLGARVQVLGPAEAHAELSSVAAEPASLYGVGVAPGTAGTATRTDNGEPTASPSEPFGR